MAIVHGGDLITAAKKYARSADSFIDLSTGISPWSWPVPKLPEFIWQQLPNDDDGLCAAAASFYCCEADEIVATAGSQFAIQQLPCLFSPSTVAIPQVGFQEHALAWQNFGHQVTFYQCQADLLALVTQGHVQHVVVINPNNPTTEIYCSDYLSDLAAKLDTGVLIVDEAFNYGQASQSWRKPKPTNVITLQSLGKFFGLAGLRVGFIIANKDYLMAFSSLLILWGISTPSRYLATQALLDSSWQNFQLRRLEQRSDECLALYAGCLSQLKFSKSVLFCSGIGSAKHCQDLYQYCASRGLLLRYISLPEDRALIRLGLIDQSQEQAVVTILNEAMQACSE